MDLDLPGEDISELVNLLKEIENAKNIKDKHTLTSKFGDILNFIATKGVPVWNAVIPYLDGVIKILAIF